MPDSSTTISPRHATARTYAADGVPIFICKPGTKKPATKHSFKDATTDAAQIDAWFSKGDYNVAMCPEDAGWCVIDIDTTDFAVLAKLGLPETFRVNTPSGGCHLYFNGSLPSKRRPLGEGVPVDFRGIGGYVLIAPSIGVNGKPYVAANNHEIVELPETFKAFSDEAQHETAEASGIPVTLEHLEHDVLPLFDADEGRDGWRDKIAALRACNVTDDADLSKRRALAHAYSRGELDRRGRYQEHPPSRYDGPAAVDQVFDTMPPKEGGVGYGSLYYAAVAAGYAGPPGGQDDAATAFAPALERMKAEAFPPCGEDATLDPRFRPLTRAECENMPLPVWLLYPLLADKGVVLVVGHWGSGKSTGVYDMAAAVAHNVPAFGQIPPTRTGHVFYVAGEGQLALETTIRLAWEKTYKRKIDDKVFHLIPRMPLVQLTGETAALAQWIEYTRAGQPVRMIVLDTMATMRGSLKENASEDMMQCMTMAHQMAAQFDCLVIIVQHPPKSAEGEDLSAKGSGDQENNADGLLYFVPDTSNPDAGLVTILAKKVRGTGQAGQKVYLEGAVVDLGIKNDVGQPMTGLSFHIDPMAGARKKMARDLLFDVRVALARLQSEGREHTLPRVAWELCTQDAGRDWPLWGTALNEEQTKTRLAQEQRLYRAAPGQELRPVARQAAKGRPWLFSLPTGAGNPSGEGS